MANGITPQKAEDFITRRWLIMMSRASLIALEKRVMDMVRVLYMNPSKCFSRKNEIILKVKRLSCWIIN